MWRLAPVLLVAAVACGGSKKDVVEGGDPSAGDCEPGRCMEEIAALINDHRPAARRCYEAGHALDPKLRGELVMKYEIDAAGSVVDVSQGTQDGQITDTGVVDCVADVIRQIKFAKSPSGKSTRGFHRYEFSPP